MPRRSRCAGVLALGAALSYWPQLVTDEGALAWLAGRGAARRAFRQQQQRQACSLRATQEESSVYDGVRWIKEKWYWSADVENAMSDSGDRLDLGLFDTEQEAARARDCAQVALDQMYPSTRNSKWQRNLPKETLYQDEIDAYIEKLQPSLPPREDPLPEVEAEADADDATADDATEATSGTEKTSFWAVAKHSCNAEAEDELSFRRGERIEIIDDSDPDWWEGRIGDSTGALPSNYVVKEEES
eukprot:TRINITY_DN39633_c0_g1_i1.p1 TRINITY_DN39633_c0_g1~~TRINITY_DN39633_c0_g1_i1.p1  ORF type:complete len:244 (+),score=74.33 TRINITY_DN39633_c0_g1_i1:108-839(+)